MIKKIVTIALLLVSTQALAMTAGGVAKFRSMDKGESTTLTFEFLNEFTSRMNFAVDQKASGYMLFSEGKAFIVSQSEGETIVMDMAEIGKMAASFGANSADYAQDFRSHVINMTSTGRNETVAGIKGEVYRLEWSEGDKKYVDDLVVSRNDKAVVYTRAWLSAIQNMQSAVPGQQVKGDDLMATLYNENFGILRLGDRFRLESVEIGKQDPANYVVPESTIQIPDFGALTGGAAASGDGQAASSEGGGFSKYFKSKSKRQAERQVARTDDVIDRETDRAVDQAVDGSVKKTVNKVFNKFFKRKKD